MGFRQRARGFVRELSVRQKLTRRFDRLTVRSTELAERPKSHRRSLTVRSTELAERPKSRRTAKGKREEK